MSRYRRLIAAVVCVLVLASACSSSSTEAANNQIAAAAENGEIVRGGQPSELPLRGPAIERSLGLAQRLVERIGDTDRALDALFLSAEHGYSGPQILIATESGTLQADGTISDATPAGPRLERVAIETKAGQASRTGKIDKRPALRRLGVVRLQTELGDKIPLDRLRGLARAQAEFDVDRQELLGLHGIMLVVGLLEYGLSPEQVIDTMVLGLFFYERDGVCYTQALPIQDSEPVIRACDNAPADSSPAEPERAQPAAPLEQDPPAIGAQYIGSLEGVLVDDPDSMLSVMISPEGVVTGQLAATEQLDNYIASVDLCGIVGDREDCDDDSVVSCPATVVWSSDLSTLQFSGTAPDNGTVGGTITIVWDTTPDGCGEPSTETTSFEIEATVSPDAAQITVPLEIDLERVRPES